MAKTRYLASEVIDEKRLLTKAIVPGANATESTAILKSEIDRQLAIGPAVVFLHPESDWEINDRISVQSNLSDVSIFGQGSRIVRAAESLAVVQSTHSAGAGPIAVTVSAVPAHWKVGSKVFIRPSGGDGSHASNVHNFGGTDTISIQSISGNVVTLGQGIDKPIGPGDEMVLDVSLFQIGGLFRIEDTLIDGNRAANTAEDWLVNWTVKSVAGNSRNRVIARNCEFTELPGENLSCGGGSVVEDCLIENTNGSLAHISTAANQLAGIYIERNRSNNTNQRYAELAHSEGLITFSNLSRNVHVVRNDFKNGNGAAILGDVSHSDGDENIFVKGNNCENFGSVLHLENSSNGDPQSEFNAGYKVDSNIFHRCGDITCVGSNFSQAAHYRDIEIVNNVIRGGRVHLKGPVTTVSINENTFYGDGFNFPVSRTGDARADAFIFVFGDRVSIKSNRIYGSSTTTTPAIHNEAKVGIRVSSESGGNQYRYNSGCEIIGNQIEAVEFGILGDSATQSDGNSYRLAKVRGNQIVIGTSNAIGLVVMPGWDSSANTVLCVGQVAEGIRVLGVKSATAANRLGGIARGNIVRATTSPTYAIRVGYNAHENRIYSTGNLVAGVIRDETASATDPGQVSNISIPIETNLGFEFLEN